MPAIIPIAGLAISAYSAHKNAKAAGQQNAIMGQQQQNANASATQNLAQGKSLFQTGMPATQNAINYYSTILRGSRSAMQLATAGPAAQLTDVYRGAERGLERSGVRGGSAVQAQGELARDRANSIAQLTTGQQGGAAEGLSRIGAAATGQGVTATAEAGGTANTGSEIAGKQAQYDTTNERGDIANAGKSAGEILKAWQNRGQGNSGWKPWTWGKDNVPTYSGSAG